MLKLFIKLKYYLYNLFVSKKHRKINIRFFSNDSWVISTSTPILTDKKIILGYKITFLFSTDDIKTLNKLNFDDILKFNITDTKLINFCSIHTKYFYKSSIGIKNINSIIDKISTFETMHEIFYERLDELKCSNFIMDQDKKYNFLSLKHNIFKIAHYNNQFNYQSVNENPGVIIINNIYEDLFQNYYWYENGLLHNINKPAVIIKECVKFYQNGKLHNPVGPAIKYSKNVDKKNQYYLKGEKIYSDEDELNSIIKKERIINFKNKYNDFLKNNKLKVLFE